MTIGHNTPQERELLDIVERVERVRAEKKELSDLESAILADAKSRGFTPARIRDVVKRRAMKPHERATAEAELELYLHATGDAIEAPIHRIVSRMSVDVMVREEVIENLKAFCPEDGSIILEHGGKPIRLSRTRGGPVTVEEVEKPAPAGPVETLQRAAPPPVPDVTAEEAEAMGREAFRANVKITDCPFPYGDMRRRDWDRGWREAAGNDGMGAGGA